MAGVEAESTSVQESSLSQGNISFLRDAAQLQSRWLFSGLRGTLLATFLLLTILMIGLTVPVSIILGINTSRELVLEELASEVDLNEQAVLTWLDERKHDLAVIVNNLDDVIHARQVLTDKDIGTDYEAFRGRLEIETGPTSRFEEIFLLDTQGRVVLSTNEASLDEIHQDQDYFQNGLLAPFISSPIFNQDKGEFDFVVTVPVRDEFGSVIGVLVGQLNSSDLSEIIPARTGSTRSGETYLVSNNRRFLTEPRFQPNSETARSEGIERALTPGSSRNGQGIYTNYNGVRVVGAYRWIPDLEIVMLAEKAEDEALEGVRRLALFGGGVAVLTLVIAVTIALITTSRITRPISALTRVATVIAEGDLTQRVTVKARNEIGLLAQAFNVMTDRLRNLIDTLEDRIQERTHALEIGADISGQLVAILDADELLKYLVNRIREEFKFYHTHIYLIEEGSEDLVMTEGSGEVGQKLKEQGHRLPAGHGIVGTVASTNEAFLSNNVDNVLNFVRNPLLPNTKSELAVPLRKGDRVLGVLDIQSEKVNRFTPADISLMQSIANQTAIAIDNARLLSETQNALQEVGRLNRQLTGEVWEQTTEVRTASGYQFKHGVSIPVTPDRVIWLPPMKQAVAKRQLIKQIHPGNGESPKAELAAPLVLRGQVIGALGIKREEASDWTEDEVIAVETLTNQIALALENARLSEEQEKTIVQLTDVDRLKSEFLTSMSHELRTPLNSIIGFADVLLQGIDGELNEMAMNDVRLIHSSGQHLLALINDILDLSKIEAGKMELVREPLQVADAIRDILAASTALLKDKPVEIVVEAGEALPPIYADKLRFNQILLNLVSNSAKFTDKGCITLKAEIYEPGSDKMLISVTDTGIGIPPDKVDTIFDRFRQVDSSSTRHFGGTGLGLAICKQLVELHGGEIWITSEEGVGSTFFFTIPLDQAISDELTVTTVASN